MSIETVAARLTEAVYPVALRYATVDCWVDLELELWKVLRQTVRSWKRNSPGESRVF